jgi:hypothetical protein
MNQGWHREDFLVLFTGEEEILLASERCGNARYPSGLPSHWVTWTGRLYCSKARRQNVYGTCCPM